HVIDRPRASRPPNRAAVRMVAVEHLRAAVHQAELRRISHVRARDRRRRIAERVAAVAHRLVFEAEVLVLHVHIIDAERFAAIIQRAAAWTVGIGQRIALGKELALLIDRAECLITDFMVDQHELPEIRTGAVSDDRLPPAGLRSGIATTDRLEILGALWLDHERAEQPHDSELAVVAVAVELPATLLGARMDVPLEFLGLVL